jgi:N-carbamoyl-L-amino-acid hydrolase
VVAGSHLDSQPSGGRYDGVFGVLAGLEALLRCDDLGLETEAPLEVINWTNEEGARFAPATMGSAVFAQRLALDAALAAHDRSGVSVGEALRATGYAGPHEPGYPVGSYFEAHIEQGPVLEHAGEVIGVVTGAQGQFGYNATVHGSAGHSGTTPMGVRSDAVVAAAAMVLAVRDGARRRGPDMVATVGAFDAFPGTRNTIAGRTAFTIDVRDPRQKALDSLERELLARLPELAAAEQCQAELRRISAKPPEVFDPELVDLIDRAAATLELPGRRMMSGAGHDACPLSHVAPAAMLFIPCRAGLSHNEAEYAEFEHIAAGADVLATAMVERAGRWG